MNSGVELSRSNRAICIVCSKKILKGVPRIKWMADGFICPCCANNFLIEHRKYTDEMIKEWKTFYKKYSKEIVMWRLKDAED